MVTSGNITKYVYHINMNNIFMVYWHIIVVPKFSIWFNSDINSYTSVEITAYKLTNLLTKQEPEGVYNTDLHELQKQFSLKLPYDWGKQENHIFRINIF